MVNIELDNNFIKLLYKLINDLLYFDNNKKDFRLYISIIVKVEIFKFTYNKISYSEYTRIFKRLIQNLYIYNISIKLYNFFRYYFYYQVN